MQSLRKEANNVISKIDFGRRRRAFTLIEVIVAGVIFLIVLGGVLYFYLQSAHTELSLGDKVDLFQKGRRVYFELTEELKMGSSLLRPPRGTTAPFVLFTNGRNELVSYFVETVPAAEGKPAGKRLRRINFNEKDDAKRITTLLDQVEDLRFTRKGVHDVAIRLFLKASEKDRLPLATSVTLRNVIHPIETGRSMTAALPATPGTGD